MPVEKFVEERKHDAPPINLNKKSSNLFNCGVAIWVVLVAVYFLNLNQEALFCPGSLDSLGIARLQDESLNCDKN